MSDDFAAQLLRLTKAETLEKAFATIRRWHASYVEAEVQKLRVDRVRECDETALRRAFVAELVRLRSETRGTAYVDPDATEPVLADRLRTEPLRSLEARVYQLRSAGDA